MSYAEAVEGDKTAEALESAFKLLMLAAEEAKAHPKPEQLLVQEAEEALRGGDWARAEGVYRKALAMKKPSGGFGFFHIINMSLSGMLQLIGRLDDAWTAACSATEAAQKADLYPLVAKALQNEARCARQRGDPEKALRAAACIESAEVKASIAVAQESYHLASRLLGENGPPPHFDSISQLLCRSASAAVICLVATQAFRTHDPCTRTAQVRDFAWVCRSRRRLEPRHQTLSRYSRFAVGFRAICVCRPGEGARKPGRGEAEAG